MQKPRKRKKLELQNHPESSSYTSSPTQSATTKPSKLVNGTSDVTKDPYPSHLRPTPDECRAVRDDLLALHGFPKEFAEYRKRRQSSNNNGLNPDENAAKSEALDLERDDEVVEGGYDANESVLDGLVRTVLSQNTTEINSQRAFASLKSAFPTWEDVLEADSKSIENAIRCGGLAPTKASCVKNIMRCLLEKKGKLCLEYLRHLSVDEIKAELSQFKGIGPKTVFEIAKAVGWVPAVADRNKTYLHLNKRIPNELKFDLNCLLFTHGKACRKCTKKGGLHITKELHDYCPLLHYCRDS
ncbi:putative DNA glycosylase At3g47830 isoform X2 [Ziziphus jujuba]|uniref:DNA glycosylase At3g47830 isoform X2 n=1 Tax=Ziziphus jujuba TaxID=326968 RepID=A0ABM3II92_ZIZJJ|nr:putative DNA glycosylase At3g47830 isoform X2 [Ziziphus jujuba]